MTLCLPSAKAWFADMRAIRLSPRREGMSGSPIDGHGIDAHEPSAASNCSRATPLLEDHGIGGVLPDGFELLLARARHAVANVHSRGQNSIRRLHRSRTKKKGDTPSPF